MEIENIIVDIVFALINVTIGFFMGVHYYKKAIEKQKLENMENKD